MNLSNIKQHVPQLILEPGNFSSAVSIPLVQIDGQYHILFEVRSSKLDTQPGDICFPGGRVEPNETFLEAALRETCEELLIKYKQIEILGSGNILHDRNRVIYSFVTEIHDYTFTYSSEEVDHVFTVPLNKLLEITPEAYLVDRISTPQNDFPFERIHGGKNYPWRIIHVPEYFYEYENHHIWGVTAVILKSFLEIIR